MGQIKKGVDDRSISFADLSANLLKHASKLGLVAEVVPLLTEIAQSPAEMATEVPTVKHKYTYLNQAGTIKALSAHLDKLLNRLKVDSRTNDENEAKAQKAFDDLKRKLDAIIAKLATDIRRTKTQIKNMTNCVDKENAIYQTANNKVNRNRRLKNSAAHTCADFAREFVQATRNRLEEIRTLQAVIMICQRRFGQLPADLVAYLEVVKKGFKAYVNSTVFQQYVAYVEKHIADNVYGRALAHGKRYRPRKLEAKILAKKNLRRLTGTRRPRVLVAPAAGKKARRHRKRGRGRRGRRLTRAHESKKKSMEKINPSSTRCQTKSPS
jgi:hypothetical protein